MSASKIKASDKSLWANDEEGWGTAKDWLKTHLYTFQTVFVPQPNYRKWNKLSLYDGRPLT